MSGHMWRAPAEASLPVFLSLLLMSPAVPERTHPVNPLSFSDLLRDLGSKFISLAVRAPDVNHRDISRFITMSHHIEGTLRTHDSKRTGKGHGIEEKLIKVSK